MATVIVIGGGVGGLTAAHELAERGFDVHLYEAKPDWGGKARSQSVASTGTAGRRDLPGEHGFRFYPRFYKHVIDLMKRTPVPGTAGRSVDQQLRPTTESAIAMVDDDTWYRFYRRRLDKPYDVLEAMELFFQELDFDASDFGQFALKILQFFTSSDERRLGQYDRLSWWEFLDGDRYSPRFQRQLRAVPRTMVAMDPRHGSARTIGTISMQLILDFASSGVTNDRTMGGPTSEMWIDHWVAHLRRLGVQLHMVVDIIHRETALCSTLFRSSSFSWLFFGRKDLRM
jgi:15-cis-phytoene desaturase